MEALTASTDTLKVINPDTGNIIRRSSREHSLSSCIMSHNMQGGYKTTAIRSTMLQWISERKPLAVLLQETWLSGDDKFLRNNMAAEAPEYTLVTASSCNHTGRGGTAVILHKSVSLAIMQDKVYAASEGNILAVPVRTLVSGQLMWLVSIIYMSHVMPRTGNPSSRKTCTSFWNTWR